MTFIRASAPIDGDAAARGMLWSVVGLLIVEMLAEIIIRPLGWSAPQFSFLAAISDSFDDYFKFVLSFPADGAVRQPWLLRGPVSVALGSANPYRTGVADLPWAYMSHFHAPPVVALFCLGNAALARLVDPGFLFLAVMAGLAAYWVALAIVYGRTPYQRLVFGVAGLLSYPYLLMMARGNVYAGATGLLIAHAMLLAVRDERPLLAALLLAVAINIRPNAVVLLPLLPLLFARRRMQVAIAGIAWTGLVFAGALALAHRIYPDYTWRSFLAGLAAYYRAYVPGPFPPAFTSSVFGALKVLVGYRPGLDLVATLPGFVIVGAASLLAWRGRLEPVVLLFLLSAGYCLSSTLFGDYHLIPFAAVPLALATRGQSLSPRDGAALIASCLLLAPKCYLFGSTGVSPQVVLNPLILLVSAGWILARAAADAWQPQFKAAHACRPERA